MSEIAIIDLWTDTNRGDAALQLSLVAMLRRKYPGARIVGVFRFGTNEIDDAAAEITETSAAVDETLGGLRRTYYAGTNSDRHGQLFAKVISAVSFLEAMLHLLLFRSLGRRSRALIGARRYRTLVVLRDAEVVVWKGKNFRDYSGATAITRSMTLTGAGYFAGLLRDRVDCVNASFWPIENALQRAIYRQAFRRCDSVTVRDQASLTNVQAVLPSIRARYVPDLSFDLVERTATRVRAGTRDLRWDVALTVTAWGSPAEQDLYLDGLVAAVEALTLEGASRFVVVPQVTRQAEDNAHLVGQLVAALGQSTSVDVEVLPGSPAIPELLDEYRRCRMLIGSRMHSCVFARSVDVPFVAVAYDTGPKWDVLSSFWDDELILPYGSRPSAVADGARRVWKQGAELVDASRARWEACVTDSARNLELVDD